MSDTDRLNWLLRFFSVEDIGDESVCLAVSVNYEKVEDALPVYHDCGYEVTGSMMTGWKADIRAVIDAAIERERKPS